MLQEMKQELFGLYIALFYLQLLVANSFLQWYNDTRSDFSALPFSFNVAVYKPGKGNEITRYPWIQDSYSGSDPAVMNPSLWGAISRQPLIKYAFSLYCIIILLIICSAMTIGDAGISEPLNYISTMTGFSGTPFTPAFGVGYTPKVSSKEFK